jgi:hypothetical protein
MDGNDIGGWRSGRGSPPCDTNPTSAQDGVRSRRTARHFGPSVRSGMIGRLLAAFRVPEAFPTDVKGYGWGRR